ncbi:cytochrome P450 monooxygenase [Cristinia sonorae]|uniref:Cytochrome P450 monooxygenase n=1 Tax=Cristinia sonorae TaxID=1940300 RepID=A0A8K0XV17_9AGAR|nr:cytochrome P450 monooxygenase [Cristinia sonorae]
MSTTQAVAIAAVALIVAYAFYRSSNSLPPPPGPKPLPVIGNVHQMPLEFQEKAFHEWGKIYGGDVIYTKIFQRSMVVLNSLQAARDLMEKRSSNYSSRPTFIFMCELLGWDTLTLMSYGNRSRKMRKWIQDTFQKKEALASYHHVQMREVGRVLARLLVKPEEFPTHFTTFSASMLMEITYGHRVANDDDFYVRVADRAIEATAKGGGMGSTLVDFFPILKYYPLWLPGSQFKRMAARTRELVQSMINAPYDMVKQRLESGAWPSMIGHLVEQHLHDGEISAEDEADIRGVGATIYSAGTETTATVMSIFILAMVREPDVYAKMQAEMEKFVGFERLPDLEDRQHLPYLNAVIKELYRWQPPSPLGLPHMVTNDDEYRGCRIPGQAMLISNIWSMSRDESLYPNPEKFDPERYLDPNIPPSKEELMDPKNIVFGFGRRACPGKEFADTGIYLMVSHIVATMSIAKATEANGQEITPPAEFEGGASRRPKPFKCVILPRSSKAVDLIRQLESTH